MAREKFRSLEPMRPQDLGIGRLFENVRDAVIVAEATTGRIVLWNPSATEVFGYSRSEALDEFKVEDLVPERLKAQHRMGMARYRDTGHGPYVDSRTVLSLPAVRKTGEEIRVEFTLSPVEPADASAIEGRFVLAIVRDVTERERAEAEIARLNEGLERSVAARTGELEAAVARLRSSERTLRESEERYRLLLEGAKDYAIFAVDTEGRVASWNAGAERLFGYEKGEIVGEQGSLLFTPEDRRGGVPDEELRRARTEGRAEDERWHLRKDGSRFFASGFVRPVRDEEGKLCGFSKVARDVTERKKAQEALRESEERFRLLVEGVRDYAIFMLDPEGRVTTWNLGAERIKGYRAHEIIGRHFSVFYPEEDVARGKPARELQIAEAEGTYEEEGLRVRKDGSNFWASILITALRDEEGNLRGFAKVTRDITERKRAEEALREVREAERSRMARDLHDGALQDITYATAEAQVARILLDDVELDDRLEQVVVSLQRGAQGLREAVYDLRLQEERDRPLPEALGALLEMNRQMNPRCDMRLKLRGGVPSSSLGETGVELLRVVQEALTNARHHSGAENVSVSLRTEGDGLVAEVEDDGRGFDPGATRAGGIGQKSMRERTTALGGELKVESEPGKGTRVRVRIPLSVANWEGGERRA